MKKIIIDKLRSWHNFLKYVLWVDQTTIKLSIQTSHFQLVFGHEETMYVELELTS